VESPEIIGVIIFNKILIVGFHSELMNPGRFLSQKMD